MDKISRTKKKKAAEQLQKLGEALVRLDDTQLDQMDLPPELRTALSEARGFKSHGAFRRQLQYIGRLMRDCDCRPIEQALQKSAAENDAQSRRFKIVTRWRDELVNGDSDRLDWLVSTCPSIDRPHLVMLVNCACGVSTQMNAKAAARQLFRYLDALAAEAGV